MTNYEGDIRDTIEQINSSINASFTDEIPGQEPNMTRGGRSYRERDKRFTAAKLLSPVSDKKEVKIEKVDLGQVSTKLL